MHPSHDATTTGGRLLAMLRDGPATAQQLGQGIGLDVSSVRRHLDAFSRDGLVRHEDRVAGAGRPRRHYALTESGRESFPRDYALLLAALLARMQERVGRAEVLAAFEDVAAQLASDVPAEATLAARLVRLERLYNALGFEATMQEGAGGAVLVQRNCPFLRTATADPEALCQCLDQGILRRGVPEATVSLASCMATGDATCRHELRIPKEEERP